MKPATQINAITAALHGWAAYHTEWKTYFNSYALQTPAGVILIDPTKPAPAALQQLEALGQPAAIVLTNAHHDRDSDWFRKHYEVQIYAHEKAAPDCDSKIDVLVVEGEKILGAVQAFSLPGVSPSEMALFAKADGGIILLGDAILNGADKGLELLPEQYIEDKKLARQSLRKLLDLEFKTVTFAHGEPLTDKASKALGSFLKSHH
jgi:glyoxylase-like metal-dependent hydrolase (beta-lactamase superfamily II)